MKNVINDIRGHHWGLGDIRNDFRTTTGATYQYDPRTAGTAKGSLDQSVVNDLRATHYKLGYYADNPQTTHQTTFVPVNVEAKKPRDTSSLRKSNIEMSNVKRNVFDSKSIYMVDFVKKENVE